VPTWRAWPGPRPKSRAAESRPSIAVLPFTNMSRDADDEYFSDGLAEEIINALVQVPGLKVIARTSAFAFKGKVEDVRRVAEVLGVKSVLEGSVRRAGNRLRVTAQLIEATDGSHQWSQRFDRDLEDVFAIQDEIAQAVASALRTTLLGDSGGAARYTPALPAYEALLKARHYLQRWTAESLTRGRDHLAQAAALDPRFAAAHSALGWCLFGMVTENLILPSEAGPLMRASAQRALAIDPSLADPYSVLALAAVLDYDWPEAGKQFALAFARDPVSPTTRYFNAGFYLAPLGRTDEAMAQLERAIQEDPLNLIMLTTRGMLLVSTNRSEEAERVLRKALDLDEGYWLAHNWLAASYMTRGRFADAARSFERSLAGFPNHIAATACLAGCLDRIGDAGRAASLFEAVGDGSAFGAPFALANYYLVRADLDRAAEWFEKGHRPARYTNAVDYCRPLRRSPHVQPALGPAGEADEPAHAPFLKTAESPSVLPEILPIRGVSQVVQMAVEQIFVVFHAEVFHELFAGLHPDPCSDVGDGSRVNLRIFDGELIRDVVGVGIA